MINCLKRKNALAWLQLIKALFTRMKKRFWKIEYSIVIVVIFAIVLIILPSSIFTVSKQASFISKWNETYDKADYMFTAMAAQADSEIVKGLKNSSSKEEHEKLMIQLIKPYLRLEEHERLLKHYHQYYMNGQKVKSTDEFYFENIYLSDNSNIVGIKDLLNKTYEEPALVMMFDINGLRGPNTWGKDVYGVYVYIDGTVRSIGYGWEIEKQKQDCSESGTGISCSHYYRIGGEFNG